MMSDLVNDWLGEYDDFEPSTAGQKGWDFADFEADDEISRMFNFGTWGGIRPYEFSPDNPFSDHPAPLLRGIELFDAGELSDAILAFEAAAQRDMQVTTTLSNFVSPPLSNSLGGSPPKSDASNASQLSTASCSHGLSTTLLLYALCCFSE
jgi:hypothetical protein